MHALERLEHHQLRAQQADAVDRQRGGALDLRGLGEVHEQASWPVAAAPRPRAGAAGAALHRRGPLAREHDALRGVDRDHLAVAQRRRWPSPVPTTQGTPSSRETIAAWQVMPPESVTIAAARRISGTQSGAVMCATSTSPPSRSPRLGQRA